MKQVTMKRIVVTGSFDDFKSRHIRILQEASSFGLVHVLLWSDEVVRTRTGQAPKFQASERQYLLESTRYVNKVTLITNDIDADTFPVLDAPKPDIWVVPAEDDSSNRRAFCSANDIDFAVLSDHDLAGFPAAQVNGVESHNKKVIVTGCYDWFHSGHVRFFEETSELGDLYVVAGNDANVRLLKGEGHPFFSEEERRYMVQSIRFVKQALISSGSGWMDAEPEIAVIQPDIYAVNEDGDVPEKRAFCESHSIEYVVLERLPKEGLTPRESTDLRGF
ncbi:MAG: adenylyltransferase/cytidyltransferase family protein [Chloroflexi bacterium]|nr:adenylyltransferase/cytidyltransferase family protein [Chloroflexota bacterium]